MANSFWILLVIAVATTELEVALAVNQTCAPPRHPGYGGYSPYRTNYSIGSRINFHCDKGYTLHGVSWTECKWDKMPYWIDPPPICTRGYPTPKVNQPLKRATTCPRLSGPQNGKVRLNGYTPGSKAYYSCDFGFKLNGNKKRQCKPNGRWSGRIPACRST